MTSKLKTVLKHANRRCKERFGVSLKKEEQQEVIKLIQRHEAVFVERQSNRITVWDVLYKNTDMRVVYDTSRKVIVTVLFRERERIDENGQGSANRK